MRKMNTYANASLIFQIFQEIHKLWYEYNLLFKQRNTFHLLGSVSLSKFRIQYYSTCIESPPADDFGL